MEKRYQVFVSSTYDDLRGERQEVMHALLELDCIPSGMELFPAADESQWSLIQRVIDDCDYYVLILAGRYGSCGPDGTGYTEKEYRYALEQGKPTIAFLHKDPSRIEAGKSEPTDEGKEKLTAFRSLAEEKLCKYWTGPAELGSAVSRSLIQLIKRTPAIGWVRADELPDKDAALELLKLRQRVEQLESELARARTTPPKGTDDLAQGEELQTLSFRIHARDPGSLERSSWKSRFDASWDTIFGAVAPLMINEVSDLALHAALDDFVLGQNRDEVDQLVGQQGLNFQRVSLDNGDFQTVKVQLRALGLITKSEKARSVKDTETYWTLTPYGDDVMTRLRAIKRSTASGE